MLPIACRGGDGEFGDSVRSKTETAQVNELLCKVQCHNLCVLVQAVYDLDLVPVFWADRSYCNSILTHSHN